MLTICCQAKCEMISFLLPIFGRNILGGNIKQETASMIWMQTTASWSVSEHQNLPSTGDVTSVFQLISILLSYLFFLLPFQLINNERNLESELFLNNHLWSISSKWKSYGKNITGMQQLSHLLSDFLIWNFLLKFWKFVFLLANVVQAESHWCSFRRWNLCLKGKVTYLTAHLHSNKVLKVSIDSIFRSYWHFVVLDMYKSWNTVVRCSVGVTEELKVEMELHQGSALSSFLFWWSWTDEVR